MTLNEGQFLIKWIRDALILTTGAVTVIRLMSSDQFSSVQDVIHALGKAHMRSIPLLWSFHRDAFETIPMFV